MINPYQKIRSDAFFPATNLNNNSNRQYGMKYRWARIPISTVSMVGGRAKTAHGIYASALRMTRKVQKKYLKYVPETIRSGSSHFKHLPTVKKQQIFALH
jgi:hypothetical protein